MKKGRKEGRKERQKAKVKTERLLILKRKTKEDMHNVQIVAKAAFCQQQTDKTILHKDYEEGKRESTFPPSCVDQVNVPIIQIRLFLCYV